MIRNLIVLCLGVLALLVSLPYYGGEGFCLSEDLSAVIAYCLLLTVLVWFFGSKNEYCRRPVRILAGGLALLFASFVAIGRSFLMPIERSECFGSWQALGLFGLQIICYAALGYPLVLRIIDYFEHGLTREGNENFDLRRWLYWIVGVRMICFFALYPGLFDFDAAVGLRTFLDPSSEICNHHPVFIQMLHAAFFCFGQWLGHRSVGIACLTLILVATSSTILMYGIRLAVRSGLPRRWLTATAAIYAFFPLFTILSVYPTKDGIFAYSFLLWIFTLYDLYLTRGEQLSRRWFRLVHGLALVLVCLSRHQGIYLVIPEVFILFWLYRERWRELMRPVVVAFAVIFAFNQLLLPSMGVEPGGKQEMLGTLFQQTAYYLKKYPHEVTDSERQRINLVLCCDTIVQRYDYYKTDAVKNTYRYNPSYRLTHNSLTCFKHIDHTGESEALGQYLTAWAEMGLKHPVCYLKASMMVMLGFFYNNNTPFINPYTPWASNTRATTDKYKFWHTEALADYYWRKSHDWILIPIVNLPIAIPTYVWMSLLLIALLLFQRDYRSIVVFLPVIFSLGFLLVCPVAFGRYAYPMIVTAPLLTAHLKNGSLKKNCIR